MDLIVTDAVFVTMAASTKSTGPAEAMLIRDGRIAEVGPTEAVRAAAQPGAKVVSLGGATVIPGLIDAHCHVADVGYLATAADCSQPSAPDIPAIQARLREAAGRTPEACVLNSAALAEAGFSDRQPDPPRGAFGRDGEGRLDGVVFEAPMFALFERNLRDDLARMGSAGRARLVQLAARRLAAFGLTTACDADMRRDTFAAFADADANGTLALRVYGMIVHDQVDRIPRARHSDKLATEAVKIWADGGMSSRTAAIHGSYPVPPYGSGILYFERDELTEMVRRLDGLGFQVCIHAQGDRAIETVLDAYAAVIENAGLQGNLRRHRIEHGGAMYPPLTARAAALGIVMVSQPGFMSTLGDGFSAAFGDRADELYAFASWRRAGLTVAGSSDAPVITADPLLGIRDAILRRTGEGRMLGPDERLSALAALDLYTTQAAYAARRETEIGSLEPGKLADFVVLDTNPIDADPEQITDITVLATVLGGTPVYQSGSVFPEG
jgi:predicted amidohydrolase YtcJ